MKDANTVKLRVLPFALAVTVVGLCVTAIYASFLVTSAFGDGSSCSVDVDVDADGEAPTHDHVLPYDISRRIEYAEWQSPYEDDPIAFEYNSAAYTNTQAQGGARYPARQIPLTSPPGRKYLVPAIQPILGMHHPNEDAVFAMARGDSHSLEVFLPFIGTLLDSGFAGDIVMGVKDWSRLTRPVQRYFQHIDDKYNHRLVLYTIRSCTDDMQRKRTARAHAEKEGSAATDGSGEPNGETAEAEIQSTGEAINCKLENVYMDPLSTDNETMKDISGRRREIHKARYEYYWIWSLQYNSEASRVLLVNDLLQNVYFQRNPFAYLPEAAGVGAVDAGSVDSGNGSGNDSAINMPRTLFTFQASRTSQHAPSLSSSRSSSSLGNSRDNAQWIQLAYSEQVLQRLSNRSVSTAGIVVGGKIAIATYALSMLFDMDAVQKIGDKRADGIEAHHNVLLHTGRLQAQDGIDHVVLEGNFEHILCRMATPTANGHHEGLSAGKQQTGTEEVAANEAILNEAKQVCPIIVVVDNAATSDADARGIEALRSHRATYSRQFRSSNKAKRQRQRKKTIR